MDRSGFVRLLERMAEGWNEGDAGKVAACFAEELWYGDPLRYSFRRRADLLEFFRPPPGGHWVAWHRVLFDEATQTGAAEYTYQGERRYHGAVLARVDGGVVTHWREWQHVSDQSWESFVGEG